MKSEAFNLSKLPDLFALTYCCYLGKGMTSFIKQNLDTYNYSLASLPARLCPMAAL